MASIFIKRWKVVGARSTLKWYLLRLGWKLGFRGPERWQVCPHPVLHDLTVRLRGSSDLNVFSQIFIDQEYSRLTTLDHVSLVLDLGANVGYSSAYFLGSFPEAHVVAVEPDSGNMEVCRINLMPYGDRVSLLHGAVWSESKMLSLSQGTYGDGREWATQVLQPIDGNAGNVQAWDVGSLMDMTGHAEVDLLKVDIEGSELQVFGETAKAWLPRVRNLCIELHGADCEEVFSRTLAGFDYELWHEGELTICKNLRAKAEVC